MGLRNPKTGMYETPATTRARLAQEKAEAELAELKLKIKQIEEEKKQKEMSEESIFDEGNLEDGCIDEDLYATRGEQFCIIVVSVCILIALFALVWWVATQMRPLLFG